MKISQSCIIFITSSFFTDPKSYTFDYIFLSEMNFFRTGIFTPSPIIMNLTKEFLSKNSSKTSIKRSTPRRYVSLPTKIILIGFLGS